MAINYNINSYEGVGLIKFGMSRNDVSKILGEPKRVRINDDGSIQEIRENEITIIYSKNSDVSEIIIPLEVGVTINAEKTLNYKEVMRYIKQCDDEVYVGLGVVVSYKLGIAIDNSTDKIYVTAFKKNQWDEIKKYISKETPV